MSFKQSNKFLKLLLIVLALSFQFEFTVVRIDKLWSLGVPTIGLIIFITINRYNKIIIPKIMFGFFFWLIWVSLLAIFWTPTWIGSSLRLKRIAYETVYFISLIFFFYCGYLVEKISLGDFLFKWIARFTAIVAGTSIFTELFGLLKIREYLYMVGNERFGGFLRNPNDYAPLALISLAYWINTKEEPISYKILSVIAITFSFIAGGSKGPILIVTLYFVVCIWNYYARHTSISAQRNCLYVIGAVLCIGGVGSIICFLLKEDIKSIPSLSQNRVINMILNPGQLLNADGSDRLIAWNGAILQILKSPILGVGIGGSKTILTYIDYVTPDITPHNIYLELMAQCGVVLALVIFFSLIHFLLRMAMIRDYRVFALQQAIVLVLLDGLFFASDWSTVPWVILGILYYKGNQYIRYEKLKIESQ